MTIAIGFQQQVTKELISQAQSGDMLAFEKIYNTYANACFQLAFGISRNRTLAQDIVQEVFIKIINKIADYRDEGNFAGWIRRITSNETINRVKSESRLHLIGGEMSESCPSNDLFDHNWLSVCRDLDGLLKQLSTTSRAVLLLHEVEGYSHKEIARIFEKSESFSKTTLSRAYTSLKKIVLKQEQKNAFK
jgi:RNA polymerase sigma factor (sigma-70 family)